MLARLGEIRIGMRAVGPSHCGLRAAVARHAEDRTLYRRVSPQTDRHQHGWRGRSCDKHVREALLALGEIRGGGPQRLRLGLRSAGWYRSLQRRLAALRAWRQHVPRDASTSRFLQRHDQPAAIHSIERRACANEPSHLLGPCLLKRAVASMRRPDQDHFKCNSKSSVPPTMVRIFVCSPAAVSSPRSSFPIAPSEILSILTCSATGKLSLYSIARIRSGSPSRLSSTEIRDKIRHTQFALKRPSVVANPVFGNPYSFRTALVRP